MNPRETRAISTALRVGLFVGRWFGTEAWGNEASGGEDAGSGKRTRAAPDAASVEDVIMMSVAELSRSCWIT